MRFGERLKEIQDIGGRMFRTPEAPVRNRRRHERYKPEEGIVCPLGRLLDLSVGGLRAKSETRPLVREGQRFMMTLDAQGTSIKTPAQAICVARYGLKHFEVSVRFDHTKPEVIAALDSLAKFGFVGGTLDSDNGTNSSHTSKSGDGNGGGNGGGNDNRRKSNKPKPPKVSIDMPDPYRTLGVCRDADAETIHQGFRQRARRFHPDVNPGPDAAVMFKRVNDAYKLLGNPEWRKTYDRLVPA